MLSSLARHPTHWSNKAQTIVYYARDPYPVRPLCLTLKYISRHNHSMDLVCSIKALDDLGGRDLGGHPILYLSRRKMNA